MIEPSISKIRRVKSFVDDLRRSTTVRQTSYLYVSQIMGLILGFATSIFNTRWLGPDDFGLFCTTVAAAEFVTLFMDFGFFSSGARVLALKRESPQAQRQLVGLLVLIGLALSLLAAILLFGLSFFVVQLLKAPIQDLLRYFCVLLGILTFQSLVESVCRGTNRIGTLAVFNLMSRGLSLVLMGGFLVAGKYNLSLAMTSYLVGFFVSVLLALLSLRPVFSGLRHTLRDLCLDVRSYGFKAYTGDIASTASFRTDSLLISHFVDTTRVGHYRLANLLINPMLTFSRSLSTALFSKLAGSAKISSKVLWCNAGWLIFCTLGLVVLGPTLIRNFFGSKYDPVSSLLLIVSVIGVLSGLTQPLNMFLAAHGKGSYLRTAALVLTGCNLILNFVMIPIWGIWGACYASAVARFINLLLHLYYYRLVVAELGASAKRLEPAVRLGAMLR